MVAGSTNSLDDKLDAYGRTLERRMQEMRATGRLTEQHASLTNEIEARRKLLRDNVSTAIRRGKFWGIVKAELLRDYRSLFDNVLGFELHVDSEFDANFARRTNRRAEGQVPGEPKAEGKLGPGR